MTTSTFTKSLSAGASVGTLRTGVMQAAKRFQDARARRAVYRSTLRELGILSNRELADIGIHRSQIRGIAQDAAIKEIPYV